MQTRLRNYKHDILSFEHNIFNLGMHNPGRYCGFDTLTIPNILNVLTGVVNHSGTGIEYKNPVNVIKGPLGVLLTPQGDIVMEDTEIGPFTFDTNVGNNEVRYDLIVFNHDHVVAVGGVDGTYTVIRGAYGNAIKPILADPLKQTPIGIVEFPPNAGDLAFCTYNKIKCPDSGDGEDARLLDPNVFKAIQIQKKSAIEYTVTDTSNASGVVTHLYTLLNDGNVYNIQGTTPGPQTMEGIRIKNVPLQEGARIYLNIGSNVIIRENTTFLPVYGPKGYKSFKVNPGIGNISYTQATGGVAIQPSVGEIWELECVLYNDQWYVSKLGGVGSNSAFKRGMQVYWYGDVNTAFNSDGSGINLMSGWQVCNGLNNTPDLRGQIMAMATVGVPSVGAANLSLLDPDTYLVGELYQFGGRKRTQIAKENIPNYDMEENPGGPGHNHFMFANGNAIIGDDDFIYKHPLSTVNWTTATHQGNQDYDMVKPSVALPATVGKTGFTKVIMNTGGGNIPFEFLPPVYRNLVIQKV